MCPCAALRGARPLTERVWLDCNDPFHPCTACGSIARTEYCTAIVRELCGISASATALCVTNRRLTEARVDHVYAHRSHAARTQLSAAS